MQWMLDLDSISLRVSARSELRQSMKEYMPDEIEN